MNTKRQTIWLVSMLSLMVVLSAYYLFTQDLGGKTALTDADHLQHAAEVTADEDGATNEGTALVDGSYTISELDHDILQQLERDGYFESGVFGEALTKREQKNETESNRIMSVIADVSQDPEASVAAWAEMELLEAKNEKIAQLENELMEQYEMAVIAEEMNEMYKVVVTSDTLEKKQAAQIIDQVMTVMEVKPEQISVQFLPNP